MERGHYERLSGLDESFLAFETPNTYMHVAITGVFESGPLASPSGGIDVRRIRTYVASRLKHIPRYRQRLRFVPLLNDAVWVDDDGFDLAYHVRHASLPRPGGDRQLRRRVAEILERPLDRTRPLWEIWIIEGLSGNRFAMLAKVHHCMVDGVGGVDLLAVLLGTDPNEKVERPDRWVPRPAPGEVEMLASELARRTRATAAAVRSLRRVLRDPSRSGEGIRGSLAAMRDLVSAGLRGAPLTSFNHPIGPHRRVDWLSLELSTVKAIKDRLGGTLNDVVLATVAGGVQKYLARRSRGGAPADFRSLVPVSVRSQDERGTLGNHVSIWVTPLPVREPDAGRRLEAVRATTADLKQRNQALGAQVLTRAAEWTGGALLNLAVRFINQSRQYNLIVTNVPGPPVPFYLLGSRMLAAYPHVPLFENQGLGIALFSYDGRLYWGITADWNQVTDVEAFTSGLSSSFQELCALAGIADTPVQRQRSAQRRARGIQLVRHRGQRLSAASNGSAPAA